MEHLNKKIFWDVDFKNNDIQKNTIFVIGRILEYGDENDVKWMFKNFKPSQIEQIILTKKSLSAKSAIYWASILGLPKNKILCLKTSYQKMRKSHWPY